MKKLAFLSVIFLILSAILIGSDSSAQSPARAKSGSDWSDWRGPQRNGISLEKGLPEKWSPQGENLLWKAPYGGRSAPIVMGNRVFMFNTAGEGATMQERVLCFDAETGKVIWEYRFNVYSSDVPPRRIAWSSPVGDPTTGNVYVFGACNELVALSNDGKLVWSRSLTDEFGAWTTHGGRTVSPIIEGDLIIVSTVSEGWGENSLRRHRYYAFDKRTGESIWISTPGGRPFDTTYSTPMTTTVDGMRVMISGAGDGAVHAMKVSTGEGLWSFPMSKRGINAGVVISGDTAYVSHQEENLETSEMGMLAALDIRSKGQLKNTDARWVVTNYQIGTASPIFDGGRIYHLDTGANLYAFDAGNGNKIWDKNLGTIQKASPVLADGKIYVGTENGKFFILRPGPAGCEVLDEDELEPIDKVDTKSEVGDELIASNEQILSSVAVSRGRVYLVSTKHVYAIGKKRNPALPAVPEKVENAPAGAKVATVQVVPADILIQPGQATKFRVRLYDDKARFIREETGAAWSLEGLKGAVANNQFTPQAGGSQAGMLKATVDGVTGHANVRVIPAPPMADDFSSYPVDAVPAHWINANPKYAVKELDGEKVLLKKSDNPAFQRARTFFGPRNMKDYTVEASVRAAERRRQIGDGGVVAQRYQLTLFGNTQALELFGWQIEPKRAVRKDFEWKKDTWYRLKLRVDNLPDGKVRARGKAWLASDPEPADWMIEYVDPIGNHEGSPGIFAYAPNDVFFDNIKVELNK
ncbi:MAG: PQQ-binding-like beta-propeller repeat protein [Acidobacteriota bacterium]|nr:MAG: PQQ-binding-like beta-propeller repeat protein [Acidobacteriota bacterium]